ncbi:hypothetical protein [Lutibacter sp.]|uniref:hypothetical protein n=1 Tax=Lutibacter sp. TaxID=1925666 RepID=UPI0027343FEA|nr:hypothetical protein [Lutibacter sp.]MDP3314062.1 hypothetical protein [Lutibacter sp.]
MKLKILILIGFLITTLACISNDDETSQNLNGNYTGIFTVEYPDGTTFTNAVTVTFSGKNIYKSTGNGNNNDFYPSGGNGTYEKGTSKIVFNDINIWLAHFDWNLILSGEYDYSTNGNELIISGNKNNVGFYKYKLTKE